MEGTSDGLTAGLPAVSRTEEASDVLLRDKSLVSVPSGGGEPDTTCSFLGPECPVVHLPWSGFWVCPDLGQALLGCPVGTKTKPELNPLVLPPRPKVGPPAASGSTPPQPLHGCSQTLSLETPLHGERSLDQELRPREEAEAPHLCPLSHPQRASACSGSLMHAVGALMHTVRFLMYTVGL